MDSSKKETVDIMEDDQMQYVLKTNNLSKYYGKFKALENLNMTIPKGAIYGFVGKNGAGKTTLIRLLCGLQLPTSGTFEMLGIQNSSKEIYQARKQMGAIVETPALFMDMTAESNLKQQYLNIGLPSYDGINELLQLVGLENAGTKKVKNFSLGMRQRLGIAIALCGNPDFIILDEPINGLDPQGIIEIRELIIKLNRDKGITVLISSHILDELSKLATHYGFIDGGRMIKEMSAQELENTYRKSIRMKVSDTGILAEIMDERGIEYSILDDMTADVYAELKFSELAQDFAQKGCEIISMEMQEESLESFYLSLVGGNSHV